MLLGAGTFTGTGSAQDISHGLGVTPILAVVHRTTTNIGRFKISGMASTTSKRINNTTSGTDAITALTSSVFSLGTNADVNGSTNSYRWFAIGDDGLSDVAVDSWSGDGSGAKTITVSEFADIAAVWVFTSNLATEQWRIGSSTVSHGFGITQPSSITAIGSGSFTVASALNTSGTTYYAISFKDVADKCGEQQYTGNGTSNRDIALAGAGASITPTLALVGNVTTTTRYKALRVSGMHTGTEWDVLGDANQTQSDRIVALNADAVRLGTNADVNANTSTYDLFWLAYGTPPATRRRIPLRII